MGILNFLFGRKMPEPDYEEGDVFKEMVSEYSFKKFGFKFWVLSPENINYVCKKILSGCRTEAVILTGKIPDFFLENELEKCLEGITQRKKEKLVSIRLITFLENASHEQWEEKFKAINILAGYELIKYIPAQCAEQDVPCYVAADGQMYYLKNQNAKGEVCFNDQRFVRDFILKDFNDLWKKLESE
jgi:hypothetical protein